jgi:putative membrane protein
MNRHVTISAFGLCSLLLLTNFCTAEDKKTTLNSADEQFIKHEAGAGMALEKIADYGVKKASKNDIKSFAERVLTDHIKANKELAKLAASKGVETSTVIDPKHAETYAMLESLSGIGFDKGFLATIVSVHTKCVNSFEEAAEDAKDSDLQAWAQKMLPTLKIHLEKAKALSGGTGNRAKNMRDRDSRTLTPLDQGSSKSDTEITAQIRKDIIAGHDMSLNGKNIKIITLNGLVTLRGAVNSSEEKSKIAEIAQRQVGAHNLNNQLEVK